MNPTTAAPDRQIEEHTSAVRTRREEYRVRGEKIVAKIRERHLVIENDDGKTLIEFPVTVGVAG